MLCERRLEGRWAIGGKRCEHVSELYGLTYADIPHNSLHALSDYVSHSSPCFARLPRPPLTIDESGSTRQPPSRTDQARPFAMRSVGWSNAGNRNLRALTNRMLARRARSFSSCRSHDLATKAVWQKRKAILWRHRMQKGDRSGEAKVSSPSAWHASRGIRRTFCLH